MSPEEGVVDLCEASVTVAGITSTIRPGLMDESDSLPGITFQRIVTTETTTTEGAGGLSWATIQVNCWAVAYGAVRALAEAVRIAMTDQTEIDLLPGISRTAIASGMHDLGESPMSGKGRPTFGISQDFSIAHESAFTY